jgi:hypothetical protein
LPGSGGLPSSSAILGHSGFGEEDDVNQLIERVRRIIGQTRLADFFDANTLQPGQDWDRELREGAANAALLALRTDLYASREWCQREILIAKRSGMPVVVLNALKRCDQRGSFLMDHVPQVPVRRDNDGWCDADIRLGLNLLVDESLKRVLWRHQARLATVRPELNIAWWAAHAPEPVTLVDWLSAARTGAAAPGAPAPRVLHPDPPLGTDERLVLDEIARLSGLPTIDVMTPRLLAARGG